MIRKNIALLLAIVCLFGACAAMAETPADDEIVHRIYTLQNSMETPITSLYVYESRGQNLVPDGLKPGEQVQVNVSGRYLRTPNQTLYTVEFVADGETYVIRTLHVEDLFNVLYLKGTDAVSGATVVSFTNPDGSAQQVEEVEAPGEDEIVTRTYTLENAMDKEITELYVYKSRGENLVPDGLKPGEQVQAEVFGYYLHTPNETLYTVEYTTEGDKFVNTYSIRTLHVEDLFEVLYLTGADAVAGATPVAFTAPEK
ncbi:MAG: hypothetical protein IJJ45_03990 [Clostridia bacterium]|nr:hypothetical protein [Clostridia bacterium]